MSETFTKANVSMIGGLGVPVWIATTAVLKALMLVLNPSQGDQAFLGNIVLLFLLLAGAILAGYAAANVWCWKVVFGSDHLEWQNARSRLKIDYSNIVRCHQSGFGGPETVVVELKTGKKLKTPTLKEASKFVDALKRNCTQTKV